MHWLKNVNEKAIPKLVEITRKTLCGTVAIGEKEQVGICSQGAGWG